MSTPTKESLVLRPITDADREVLYRLYASTRAEELATTEWTEDEKETFLRMQFAAQHLHYQEHYAGSSFDLVLVNAEPAGRLYVDRLPERWPNEIRLVDIALFPEYRSRGFGSLLLGGLMDEARKDGKRLTIHVEMYNPALRLYQRLGFRPIGEVGVYYLMEWHPDSAVPPLSST